MINYYSFNYLLYDTLQQTKIVIESECETPKSHSLDDIHGIKTLIREGGSHSLFRDDTGFFGFWPFSGV